MEYRFIAIILILVLSVYPQLPANAKLISQVNVPSRDAEKAYAEIAELGCTHIGVTYYGEKEEFANIYCIRVYIGEH